jgi:hypothetical protein
MLNTPLVLNPIQSVPLPKNYLFTYQSPSPLVRHDTIALRFQLGPFGHWPLADQDKIHPSGFSELLYKILHHTKTNDLWGQTIPIYGNYSQPDTHVISSLTESVLPQQLKLPEKPFSLFSPDWFDQLVAKNVPNTTPPVGRRIFWPAVAGSFPNAWMVMPNQRLEDQYPNAPFDKYSFWISAFGPPIKNSTNVTTPEALSTLLGGESTASRLPKQATTAQILSKVGIDGSGLGRHMIWSGSRLLFFCFFDHYQFLEYGASGVQYLTFADWASQSGSHTVWNIRKLPLSQRTVGAASLI